MFDKKQHSATETNKNAANTGRKQPKNAEKSVSSNSKCGCGCKKSAPAAEEIIEIEEEQHWDY